MTKKPVQILVIVICGLFCRLPVSKAELVIIGITGEVTEVQDDFGFLEGRVNIGDLITGVYIYDLSTLDSDPWEQEWRGVYEHYAPPAGITLSVGGFVFMTDPDNVKFIIEVRNDYVTLEGGGLRRL